jgi:glycosyltransferase involved in cell wall biosynthesis
MKIKKPVFSIIIPVLGRIEYVRQAIRSVQSQTVSSDMYEILIVEDKNPPKTILNLLKKEFPQIIVYKNTNDEGPGGSRQTGMTHVRGKYLCFLDSDDIYQPDFLQILKKSLEQDQHRVAAVCFSHTKFEKGFNLKERYKLYLLLTIRDIGLIWGYYFNNTYLFPTSFYLCQISHMMFRSSLIKNLKFDYDYRRGGEDWDFFIHALLIGKINIVPKRLLKFRYSPGSTTDNKLNRQKKWMSYRLLTSRLPESLQKGLFYWLFLRYIRVFDNT